MIPYFFYGSGMYRKHPNHTYRRNRDNSANNWAIIWIVMGFIYTFSVTGSGTSSAASRDRNELTSSKCD